MPFDFDIAPELARKLEKVAKKDHKRAEIISKKMHEIISCDDDAIEHYKNLRYEKKEYKRVHIDSSFALAFKVDKKRHFITFADFDHHDKIY